MSSPPDSALRIPRYELLEALAQRFPEMDPSAVHTYLWLHRVAAELAEARATHLERHDLAEGRFLVMVLILTHEPALLSPAEIAELAGVSRATMTGLLDTLQQAGFIRREPHPRDGRALVVHLTESGRDKLTAMLPDHYRRLAALMEGLTRDERETLTRLLAKVRAGIPALRDA